MARKTAAHKNSIEIGVIYMLLEFLSRRDSKSPIEEAQNKYLLFFFARSLAIHYFKTMLKKKY